jgi:hypothetical protein
VLLPELRLELRLGVAQKEPCENHAETQEKQEKQTHKLEMNE